MHIYVSTLSRSTHVIWPETPITLIHSSGVIGWGRNFWWNIFRFFYFDQLTHSSISNQINVSPWTRWWYAEVPTALQEVTETTILKILLPSSRRNSTDSWQMLLELIPIQLIFCIIAQWVVLINVLKLPTPMTCASRSTGVRTSRFFIFRL